MAGYMKVRYEFVGIPDQAMADGLEAEVRALLDRFNVGRGIDPPIVLHVLEGWIGMGADAFSPSPEGYFVPGANNRAVRKADYSGKKKE
jgi:hypothetical protein